MLDRAARAERYVRKQIWGLSAVSWIMLCLCMAMTSAFGWSFGGSLFEKFLFAAGLAVIDLAGVVSVKSSGTNIAERAWAGAIVASLGAIMCAGVTFMSVLGFQSDSRESAVATRERGLAIAEKFLEFSKNAITDTILTPQGKVKPASPSAVASGIDTMGNAVSKQLEQLKDGTIAVESDGQAAVLARLTGLSKDASRSLTVAIFAFVFLSMQYVCAWLAGFMRHRVEPLVGLGKSGKSGTTGLDGLAAIKDVARRELVEMIVKSIPIPTNLELAKKWGVSKTTVSAWRQDFIREGYEIPPATRGGKRATSFKPLPSQLNGSSTTH